MKFSVRKNKDSSQYFVNALILAGHQMVKRDPDFILYDAVVKYDDDLKKVPNFIYPHTPHTYWLWDGVYPQFPVSYNFVATQAQKQAMSLYGYPYPIEPVGFPRCSVFDFKPTQAKRLLFVPARPRKDEGRQAYLDTMAFRWVIENCDLFERVVVCHVGQFDGYFDQRIEFHKQNLKADPNPTENMLRYVDNADLILSVNTVAYLGVARGKPTVFYGESTTPETTSGKKPANWKKYEHLMRFPLSLEDMSVSDVLKVCEDKNDRVEEWKMNNIGSNFDSDKFVSLVENACANQ